MSSPGIESRGFLFAAPVALALGAGFVPVRKVGKLPAAKLQRTYALEYGEATIELHRDAVRPGQRVALVDDLLATGGTAEAACHLLDEAGGRGRGRVLPDRVGVPPGSRATSRSQRDVVHPLLKRGDHGDDDATADVSRAAPPQRIRAVHRA